MERPRLIHLSTTMFGPWASFSLILSPAATHGSLPPLTTPRTRRTREPPFHSSPPFCQSRQNSTPFSLGPSRLTGGRESLCTNSETLWSVFRLSTPPMSFLKAVSPAVLGNLDLTLGMGCTNPSLSRGSGDDLFRKSRQASSHTMSRISRQPQRLHRAHVEFRL